MAEWSLLTNHARLLLAIANEPGLRVRDMAQRLELTERAVALILRDLRESGYVTRSQDDRDARRTHYDVVPGQPFRSDALSGHTVGQLLQLLTSHEQDSSTCVPVGGTGDAQRPVSPLPGEDVA